MIFNRYARGGGGGGLGALIYVTVEAGSTVTATMGTMTRNAVYSQGVYVIDVPAFGDWVVTATKGANTATATVSVTKAGMYEVTLKYVKATLNDNDWATIRDIADASEGANYWAVGDTKEIVISGKLSDGLTLNNYSTWVYIIGFDHNSEKEGTGIAFQGFKTAQSNGTDICLCDNGYDTNKTSGQWFNMNNNNSGSGGWFGSDMRNSTLPVVKAALSTELTSVIKTTSIYTDVVGDGSDIAYYVTSSQDDLYLLAEFEIFGVRTYANTAEQNYQKQYAYYVAGNSKKKYKHDSIATAARWWERSVYATASTVFCSVNTGGSSGSYSAHTSIGLAPAFKVGSTTISALPVGSSVYCNVNSVKTEFIVVNQGKPSGMYDDSCNGTWLLMKDIYENRKWNSSGINKYESSDINTYLNNTFLNLFDSNIKDVIKQVKIPYRKNGGSGGTDQSGANGLSAKIFLLSGYEVGWTTSDNQYFPQDGAKLSYFESGTGTSANNKRIAKLNGSAASCVLRSPYAYDTIDVWYVNSNGVYVYYSASNLYGIRPALIVPLDTPIDSSNNIIA